MLKSDITVYCSGGIRKGNRDGDKLCWSTVEREIFRSGARPCRTTFLNPDDPLPDLSDSEAVFGRDMCQVRAADVIVVDARERRGVGIGVEIVAAKFFGKFVVVVAPEDSHYRKAQLAYRGTTVHDYVHPHLAALSDAIVSNFSDAGKWAADAVRSRRVAKGVDTLQAAINAYEKRLLQSDTAMAAFAETAEEVTQWEQRPAPVPA